MSDAVEVHNFRPTISVYTDRDNRVVDIEVALDDCYDESFFVRGLAPVHYGADSVTVAGDVLDAILGGPGTSDADKLRLLADAIATSLYEKNLAT